MNKVETCRFCQKFGTSLRRIGLGMLLLLLLCGGYWLMLLRSHDAQLASVEQQTRLRAAQMAEALSLQVGSLITGLDYVGQMLVSIQGAGHQREFEVAARNALAAFPEGAILQIAMADQNGQLIYSSLAQGSNPGSAPLSIKDREHFQVHAEGRAKGLFISQPVLGRVSQKWSIQLSRAIRHEGRFAGVVVISISPAYISGFFRKVFSAPEDVVMLLRDDGSYLARSRMEVEVMGKSVPKDREFLIDPSKSHGAYEVKAPVDGALRYYAWSRVSELPVVVSVGLDRQSALALMEASIESSLERNIAGTLMLFLGACWIAWLVLQKQKSLSRLEESEQRLQKLVAQVPGMIYQYRLRPDGSACFPYASPGIQDIYQVSPESVHESAARVLAVLHPEDLERITADIQESATHLTPWVSRYRVCHKDGSVRWMEGYANPEREADGSILWHGYIHDVSDAYQLHQALESSEERLRLSLEAVKDGLWEWDVAEDRIHWDRRCYEMLGYEDQAFPINFELRLELMHPLDRAPAREKLLFALENGCNYGAEFRLRTAAGGWLWVLARGQVVRFEDGRSLRMVGTHSDISERVTQSQLRRALLDQSAAVIFLATPDRLISHANARAREVFAPQGQVLIGSSFRQIHADEDAFKHFADYYPTLRSNGLVRLEYNLRDGHGKLRWFEIQGTLLDPDNPDGDVIWSMFDSDDRHRAETALSVAQRRLMAVIERFPGGVLVEDQEGQEVVVVNQALCQLLHVPDGPQALIGQSHASLARIVPDGVLEWLMPGEPFRGADLRTLAPVLGQEQSLPDGRTFEIDRVPLIGEQEGLGLFWLLRDITERKRKESNLELLAATDPLTGLSNRRAFMASLESSLSDIRQGTAAPSVVLMLDLDHFKKVNDTYGHAAGDQVLKHLAGILQSVLRRGDLAGRLGGEEFAIMLCDADLKGGLVLAERLRAALENDPVATEAGIISYTASLGLTLLTRGSESVAQCLAQADGALYAAKREGRNRVVVWTEG